VGLDILDRVRRGRPDGDAAAQQDRSGRHGPEGRCFNRSVATAKCALAGLSGTDVARIVNKPAERAGLDAAKYAGHSIRAGHPTSAAIAGALERSIMNQTGIDRCRWWDGTSGTEVCSGRTPPGSGGPTDARSDPQGHTRPTLRVFPALEC